MNSIGRTSPLKKLFRSFDECSLTTCAAVQRNFSARRKGQLQTRFLDFLEHSKEIDENGKATLIDKQQLNSQTLTSNSIIQNGFARKSLKNASSEYDTLIKSIESLLQPNQRSNIKISISSIDDDCCKILRLLSHSKILELLRLLTRARPGKVTFLKFYKYSLQALRKLLESRRLSTRESLQLLFLESLRKKLAFRDVKFIINRLPPMSDLSLMEQCVVAHVSFKCCVKLKDSKLLEDVIEANAEMLVKDPPILVTFCKALRLAAPVSDCKLENLSGAIVESNERFTMKCAAHTLSLYAEAKLECSDVLQRFFDDSMKHLIEERVEERKLTDPVEKDLDRLLWAAGILNYKLRSSDKLELSSCITRRYENLSKKPFRFANTLLSLWILNCRLKEFVEKCLAEKLFHSVLKEEELWKPVARLQLLLSCVRIEAPEIEIPDEIVRPYKVGVKTPETVKRLRRMIGKLAEKLDIGEVAVACPVNGIYIPGISFRLRSEKPFHVDILDETTCFKGTIVPHGLMNLKLRLLPKIGFHSILITGAQLNDAEATSSIIERCIKNIVQ